MSVVEQRSLLLLAICCRVEQRSGPPDADDVDMLGGSWLLTTMQNIIVKSNLAHLQLAKSILA